MIYLGADHAGFKLKEKIKKHLEKNNISYADLGAHEIDKNDDYPDFAALVAKKVAKENSARGILICGTGNGMAIAANKVKGARAALACDKYTARMAVEDDFANIIALSAHNVSRVRVNKIIKTFISAKPSVSSRHKRRVKKISELE